MKHRVSGKKLGRNTKQRKALLLSLAYPLFDKGAVKTTLAKAKVARIFLEKLITKARRKDLASRRAIHAVLRDKRLTNKLVDSIAPLFEKRPGGYLRIIRLFQRKGDNAQIVRLELVDYPKEEIETKTKIETEKKGKIKREPVKKTKVVAAKER